jgi:hypothetical protein
MKRIVSFIIFAGLIVLALPAEPNDYQLHDLILSLKEPRGCEVWQNYLLFTFRPEKKARHAGITFEHEDFSEIHVFSVNPHGVYYYLMPIPEEESVSYRLVVDGVWLTDPRGQSVTGGYNGSRLSRFNIPRAFRPAGNMPILKPGGMAEFRIVLPPGRNVTLAGDFNGWDPYMTRLREQPGTEGKSLYSVTLRMCRGMHYYWFNVDGETLLDPSNPETARTRYGENVSVFTVDSIE